MYIHKTKTKRNKAIYINITSFFMLTLLIKMPTANPVVNILKQIIFTIFHKIPHAQDSQFEPFFLQVSEAVIRRFSV